MEKLILNSKAHELDPHGMKALWERIKGLVFSLEPRQQQLGLGEKVKNIFFTVPNSSCGKVMFSQASVILSTGA